jgi:hypothetical protein
MNVIGKLNPEIQKILESVCLREGWGTTDADFAEILSECEEIYSEIGSSHRWYDEKTVVVQIEGILIQYDWYHLTGDASASDMGLGFDLSSVKFCEAYQTTITKYRPISSPV